VASENADLKLLPGMTAQITFQVSELTGILKIPNAALRFPPEKSHVRDADQKFLELSFSADSSDGDDKATSSQEPPVDDAANAVKAATKRIVWVQETFAESKSASNDVAGPSESLYTGKLKAVEITIGESDYRFTHVVSGDLKADDEVVVGLKPPGAP
jgi:HlyD family secretion protein